MVVLGIVLIAIAVLLGLGVAVSSTASTTLEVFGVEFGVVVPTVFFLGAAAGVAVMFGLWLVKKGLGRGYRRHKEVKELRHQVEASPTAASTDPSATGSSHDADTTRADTSRAGTAGAGTGVGTGTGPRAGTGTGTSTDAGPAHAAGRGDHRGPAPDPNSAEGKERAHRLGTEPYTVADGTEDRSPAAQHRPPSA